MEIKNGALEGHEKLTAKLHYKLTGETGFRSAGNVADYKHTPDKQYKTRAVSEDGFRRVNNEQLDMVHDRYEFTLDEQSPDNTRLLHLARRNADVTQAAIVAPAGTATLTDVEPGLTYFVGKRDIDTVVVEVATVAQVEGTDYTVDYATGAITVIEGGGIDSGDDLDVTFGAAEVVTNLFESSETPLFAGAIRIDEYNQHSKVPLRTVEFDGVIMITAWPEQTGEFGKFTARATARSKPQITKRHAA